MYGAKFASPKRVQSVRTRLSERDSKSFSPYIRILEDRGGYNFCYASIFENGDYLLVAYFTDGKPSKDEVSGNTYGINIKKIALDEL